MRITSEGKNGNGAESPALGAIPRSAKRRLIDDGLLHYEASAGGFSERYRRGETSHTVHVWWARRPHSAMRSLVFASLCAESSEKTLELMNELSCAGRAPDRVINQARKVLEAGHGGRPRVLDMFGGGGTIAFEAAGLGAETYSIDSNQLAVFVEKCSLVYSASTDSNLLLRIVRESGKRVLGGLAEASAGLYPLRGKAFGYYWTYSRECDGCGRRFSLSKRPWLSKKNGKRIAVESSFARTGVRKVSVGDVGEGWSFEPAWAGRNGKAVCPHCGETNGGVSIGSCRDELVAVARRIEPRGKSFEGAEAAALPEIGAIEEAERRALEKVGGGLPNSKLPRWSGIVNPALYGIERHADFLNPRQRAVLVLLIRCLKEEHERLVGKHGEEVARCATGFLSGLIDQLVDWNCRLSMWIPQNEQVGRAFCGPGVAMLWDYMETDPVEGGPANLWKKLDRIVAGVGAVTAESRRANVQHAYAQNLPFESESFDAIVTDPPYYDNVYYNALADFFYAWKRMLLKEIDPELFGDERTDESHELVASKFRSGSSAEAHEWYCRELGRALGEAERVLKKDGVFSFLYSHNSLRGWEALTRSYRSTGLRVTSVQPLSIERKQRPRAMTSDAVNTCLVFVAHKSGTRKERRSSIAKLREKLREIGGPFVESLRSSGWRDEDVGIAYYAQGVGMLANVEGLSEEASDLDALKAFESVVREIVPTFKVAGRGSL